MKHLISFKENISNAIKRLEDIEPNKILFVVNDDMNLIGSITDGDIRRGFLKGLNLEDDCISFCNRNVKFLYNNFNSNDFQLVRQKGISVVPVVDEKGTFLRFIDLEQKRSNIDIDAIIMAGGLGSRLKPITNNIPKPLIPIGEHPIIHHIIKDLISFGVRRIFISVNYLGNLIEEFVENQDYESEVVIIKEEKPLGTFGSLSLMKELFTSENVLVTNGDLLADINFEEMLNEHESNESLMTVASIKYEIQVPFAVLETSNTLVKSFKEKPNIDLSINGGVYIVNQKLIHNIPLDKFYNATDALENAIFKGKANVFHHEGKWLDIGTPKQLEKARRIWKNV